MPRGSPAGSRPAARPPGAGSRTPASRTRSTNSPTCSMPGISSDRAAQGPLGGVTGRRVPKESDDLAGVGQGGPAHPGQSCDGTAGAGRVRVEVGVGDLGLHDDHGEAVREDVVQVPGGPQLCFGRLRSGLGAAGGGARSRSRRSCRNPAPSAKIQTGFSDQPHEEASSVNGLSAVTSTRTPTLKGTARYAHGGDRVTAGREDRDHQEQHLRQRLREPAEDGRDHQDARHRREHRQRVSAPIDQGQARQHPDRAERCRWTRGHLLPAEPHVQLHQDGSAAGRAQSRHSSLRQACCTLPTLRIDAPDVVVPRTTRLVPGTTSEDPDGGRGGRAAPRQP